MPNQRRTITMLSSLLIIVISVWTVATAMQATANSPEPLPTLANIDDFKEQFTGDELSSSSENETIVNVPKQLQSIETILDPSQDMIVNQSMPEQSDAQANPTESIRASAPQFSGLPNEIQVTTMVDENDGCAVGNCSLREAIIDANAYGDGAVVFVPAGTYTLSIVGTGEDASATGDLDITSNIHIIGAGKDATIIDANNIDRVFDIDTTEYNSMFWTTIRDLTIQNGQPENNADGGGIRAQSWVELSQVRLTNNTTTGKGGGVAHDSIVEINYSEILDNQADIGGGIYSEGFIRLFSSTIDSNSATSSTLGGGGIYINIQTILSYILSHSTISNNTATNGGGIYFQDSGSLDPGQYIYGIANSTVSGNQALVNGGGFYIEGKTYTLLDFITVTNNLADSDNNGTGDGGGLYLEDDIKVIFTNSILYGNHDNGGEAVDCMAELPSVLDASYSFIGNADNCQILNWWDSAINYVGVDPQLEPLQDNGGSTQTHALMASSPAIGKTFSLNTFFGVGSLKYPYDQRGYLRGEYPYDIGAVEYIDTSNDLPELALVDFRQGSNQSWHTPLIYYNTRTIAHHHMAEDDEYYAAENDGLLLYFDEPLYTGSATYSADNPDNYLMVADGSNGVFDSTTCGVPTGDDILIPFSTLDHQSNTVPKARYFNNYNLVSLHLETKLLADDHYRLIVCNLRDIDGNPVDGNHDGVGSDNVIYDFTQLMDLMTYVINAILDDGTTLPQLVYPFWTYPVNQPIEELVYYHRSFALGDYPYIDPSHPNSSTNPDNFLLVDVGVNGVPDTETCGTIQGDDIDVSLSLIVEDYKYTYLFDDYEMLTDGRYRFIICNLVNNDDEPFDGDYDGFPGGDFVGDFTVFASPTNFSSGDELGFVELSWNDLTDTEDNFVIERRSSISGTPWTELALLPPDTESYVDGSAVCGESYIYRVQARKDDSLTRSAYSNETSITPDCANDVFVVNTLSDINDGICDASSCSLREAIIDANAYGDGAVVFVPAGTYTLSIAGTGEDASATGDLDITSRIHVVGAGKDATVIDANNIDRVFDVFIPSRIDSLAVTGGHAPNGENGGGIRIRETQVTLFDLAIHDNTATGDGGGLAIEEVANNKDSTVQSVLLNIYQNTATNGGGINLDNAGLWMNETHIHNNIATGDGGGVYSLQPDFSEWRKSAITNNSATNGGGLYIEYLSTQYYLNSMRDMTISGNEASNHGGGIYHDGELNNDADLVFSSVFTTIANNTADSDNSGGGDGGGVYISADGKFAMASSILSDNVDFGGEAPDCFTGGALISSLKSNIIEDSSGCDNLDRTYIDTHLLERDYIEFDPQLVTLSDNGGHTPTYAIPSDSIAINHGSLSYCYSQSLDQRSVSRGIGQQCDIGAYEYTGSNDDVPLEILGLIVGGFGGNETTFDNLPHGYLPSFPLETADGAFPSEFSSYITLGLNATVYDPFGNSASTDATNPSNYRLVTVGSNGVFDTDSCVVEGDDVLVELKATSINNLSNGISLSTQDNEDLPIGDYRFVACNLKSNNGLGLDGDSDGIVGGHYIHDFVIHAPIDPPTTVDLSTAYYTEDIENPQQPLLSSRLWMRFGFDYPFEYIDVEFSEPVNTTHAGDVNNYLIVEYGADEIFQTATCTVQGDDQVMPITGISYDAGNYVTNLIPQSPLTNGVYRVIVCDTIQDLDGDPIDGDDDDFSGGHHITEFELFPKPIDIEATLVAGGINITWTDINISETGYNIWRKVGDGYLKEIDSVGENVESFVDGGAICGTENSYYLQARRDTDLTLSDFTEVVSATFPCGANEFVANTLTDINDGVCDASSCSLREAIIAANAYGDGAVVFVPTGTYTLSIVGTGEDASATGDLDITANINIVGAGRDLTIIDANGIDRVFDALSASRIERLSITGGHAANGENGGGIRVDEVSEDFETLLDVILYDLAIYNNTATGDGGGLAIEEGVVYTHNQTAQLILSEIYQNTATNGGGIKIDTAYLTMNESHIHNNTATANGGGIYSFSPETSEWRKSAITNNTAVNGGGVYAETTYEYNVLLNVTVSGNEASNHGGGIYSGGGLGVKFTTIANNTADSDNSGTGDGGGVYVISDGEFEFSAGSSILADNIDLGGEAPDCYTAGVLVTGLKSNIIKDDSGCDNIDRTFKDTYMLERDYIGFDPELAPLSDNGGYTPTYAIPADSVAIDRGSASDCSGQILNPLDQRSALRGRGDKCDIGAYEYTGFDGDVPLHISGLIVRNLDSWLTFDNIPHSYLAYFFPQYADEAFTSGNIITLGINSTVYNPSGNSASTDATNLSNYRLVTAGSNGTFDTDSCVVGGDDVLVELEKIAINDLYSEIHLLTKDEIDLPVGDYRFVACNLKSNNGLGLDGGNDGIAGGHYITEFVIHPPIDLPTTVDLSTAYYKEDINNPSQFISTGWFNIRFGFDYPFEYIDATFSEAVNATHAGDVNNYLIVEYGADEIFQTDSCTVQGDDQVIPITGISYDAGNFVTNLIPQSPLTNGVYRVIVCDTIQDLDGDPIDGDYWGIDKGVGGHHITEFELFPKPIDIEATLVAGGINITWTDINISETGYGIWRKVGDGYLKEIDSVGENVESFVDGGAICGTENSYYLQARRDTDLTLSDFTEVVSATFPCAANEFVANTFTDTNDGICDASSCSLREAIIAANAYGDGAVVLVPSGTYTLSIAGTNENNANTGDLDIKSNIHIIGAGRDLTIIDANGIDRVFDVLSPSRIERLAVTKGNALDGAGIRVEETSRDLDVILSDLAIYRNTATGDGGGLAIMNTDESSVQVVLSEIYQNSATNGGGIHVDESVMRINETYIHHNQAIANGGGIYSYYPDSYTTWYNSTIADNTATNGGGIYVEGNAYITSSNYHVILNMTISGNQAYNHGGGIYGNESGFIVHTTIANNMADSDNSGGGDGGGIYIGSEGFYSTNSIFADNTDLGGDSPDCYTEGAFVTYKQNIVGNAQGCDKIDHHYIYEEPSAYYVHRNFLDRDYFGFDPQLEPLADNGGQTVTHAIPSDSIAIDRSGLDNCGGSVQGAVDQRSMRRGREFCDIGSYEYSGINEDIPLVILGLILRSDFNIDFDELYSYRYNGFEGAPPVESHIFDSRHLIVLATNQISYDPYGDMSANDVTNPSNYQLVTAGANSVFDTDSCAITGDDVSIEINKVAVNKAFSEIYLLVNDEIDLPIGNYRFVACNLKANSGLGLDGDRNGVDGDPFIFDFEVFDGNYSTDVHLYADYYNDDEDDQRLSEPLQPRFGFDYAFEYLEAKFSYSVNETHANDVTNYLIVDYGADEIFQTDGCTVQGDDQVIPITDVSYDNGSHITTLIPQTPLINGVYRGIVCDTIQDLDGDPIDGDWDFKSGGNEISEFELFPKPIDVEVALSGNSVAVTWTDINTSETGYGIWRVTDGSFLKEIGTVGENIESYIDTDISCGSEYAYFIQSRRDTDLTWSSYTEPISINLDCSSMVDPNNLVATPISSTQVDLTWNDNNGVESAYKIERRISGGTFAELADAPANATTFSDTTVACNTTYDYQIRAYRAFDDVYSGYTNIASVAVLCSLSTPALIAVDPVLGQKHLELNWTDSNITESEFQILRSISSTDGFVQVGTTSADATTYTDTDVTLECYTEYFYQVQAHRTADNQTSAPSNIISAQTLCDEVYAPDTLTTDGTEDVINLAWNDNAPDETSFEIQRAISGSASWSVVDTVGANITTYTDLTTSCGGEYDYQVRAYRDGDTNYSAFSNISNVKQLCAPPPAPSNLLLNALLFSNDIQLDWSDNSNTETDFSIERSTDGITDWTQVATVTEDVVTYTDTDVSLSCYTPYHYRIRAYRSDDSVYSEYSEEVVISTWCDPDEIITAYSPFTVNVSPSDVSNVTGFPQPSCASGIDYAYVWEVPTIASDSIGYNTFGSSFDTVMSFWRFDGINYVEVGCNDNAKFDGTSALVASFQPYTGDYMMIIGGVNGATGTITLNSDIVITPPFTAAPTFTPVPSATQTPNLTTVGLFKEGLWLFRDNNQSGTADVSIRYGTSMGEGWQPVIGDWNGDGIDGFGLYRKGRWILRDVIDGSSSADYEFIFGLNESGWQPVIGDWNGDGIDGIGIYKDGIWMLKNQIGVGDADHMFRFNPTTSPDAVAMSGDWHDESSDRVGLYDNGRWYLSYSHKTRNDARTFDFGPTDGSWQPVVGDWDEDGDDTIGVYKDGAWRLRNSNSRGNPDFGMTFGGNGGMPIAGYRGSGGALALFASMPDVSHVDVPTATATLTPTAIEIGNDEVTDIADVEPTATQATATYTLTSTPTMTETPTPTATPTSSPTLTPLPSETPIPELPEIPDNISGA